MDWDSTGAAVYVELLVSARYPAEWPGACSMPEDARVGTVRLTAQNRISSSKADRPG